ncbi:hypothetical protein [Plantactinospora endophytica]|nr:hypothetical protein [Plantactinospora endophytica]
MGKSLMPEVGSLAWAPLSAIDEVEIFDRYNGVPTLGVIKAHGGAHLYWRAFGYTGDFSLWLYVPLSPEDLASVEQDEGAGILDQIVFRSPRRRYVTVGVAHRHRLIFEREWALPPGLEQNQVLEPVASFAIEALTIAAKQSLPASRRELVRRAKEAVKELVSC